MCGKEVIPISCSFLLISKNQKRQRMRTGNFLKILPSWIKVAEMSWGSGTSWLSDYRCEHPINSILNVLAFYWTKSLRCQDSSHANRCSWNHDYYSSLPEEKAQRQKVYGSILFQYSWIRSECAKEIMLRWQVKTLSQLVFSWHNAYSIFSLIV